MNQWKVIKTVFQETMFEYEEKKSRFFAYVKPILSEKEAQEFILKVKAKHCDASHTVYAYSVGGNEILQKYCDDGEPTGTAGIPILEIIKKAELENIIIVIARYFGGTKLGSSGLTRAYGKSALKVIERSFVVNKIPCHLCKIFMDYTRIGKIKNILEKFNAKIIHLQYTDQVDIEFLIPFTLGNQLEKVFEEETSGQLKLQKLEKVYSVQDLNGTWK